MLSLDRPITVDGITVYRDHADPSRFWYLPGTVSLAGARTDSPPSPCSSTGPPTRAAPTRAAAS